ncbi:MAG TPA: hypothetical protein VL598_02415 [Trinickia sp.]|uniref:hypothetical protein n=1 Tax=Trinickia sp. TaxID=2571163 RepID=UPI002CB46DDD|nr:hypothetical protein [Trinickia sp.]HTI16500.1 hypothetical protein [Trinickia sp.]
MQIGKSHLLAPITALLLSHCALAQSGPINVAAASFSDATAPTSRTPQRQAAEAALRQLRDRLLADATQSGANRVMAGTDSDLRSATLGDGFEVNLVDPVALLTGKPLETCIRPTGQWRFIVLASGKPIGLLTIARMGGSWKMVEAGASQLAQEIAAVEASYSAQSPRPSLRFVRSLQAVADFMEVTFAPMSGGDVQSSYVLLSSARAALNVEQADALNAVPVETLSASELEDRLKARVALGLQDVRFNR